MPSEVANQQLLKDAAEIAKRPAFKSVVETLQMALFQRWLLTSDSEHDKREAIWRQAQAVGDLEATFTNLGAAYDEIRQKQDQMKDTI